MTPFMNDTGVRLVNLAKFISSRRSRTYRQSHAAFHFLLDYIPAWERAYGHLIQYQSFLPEANTRQAWSEMLTLSASLGMPAYLGVTKRHRPDGFLLSHGVDGYSLALDFKVTPKNRSRLWKMLAEFDRIVLNAGGRFYFAKNSETSAASAREFLSDQTVEKFRRLKRRCDPHHLLQTDLYRRIFG
jgi:FAD/FMN-containing dehydrogenase